MHRLSSLQRVATTGAALAMLAGCSMDVKNPNSIEASTIDPVADARVFSLSAQQNFYVAYAGQGGQNGNYINISGIYSNELWSGAVRNETNDIARHVIVDTNLDLNSQFWVPLQTAIGTNDQVLSVLKGTTTFNSDIAVARSSVWSGYSMQLLAESFCQGVLHVGPALTPAQMSDSAIARFQQAITVATNITSAEATKIIGVARVGLARAYLQKGDNTNALASANLVAPTFSAATVHVDDAQARARLGNGVFLTSSSTIQIAAGTYRALGDSRVTAIDAGINAQDGRNRLWRQTKYPNITAPVRIASGLEARYIAAEAQLKLNGSTAPALALIAERRTAGGQSVFTGTTTAQVLAELMDQRARDFWLEGKHLGDIIRNPTAAALLPAAGSPFYKAELGNFQALTCLPVPFAEKANNPNF